MLHMNVHYNLGYTEIESALLSSAEELNKNMLNIRPQKLSGKLNNRIYMDRRPNAVITRQKIMNKQ